MSRLIVTPLGYAQFSVAATAVTLGTVTLTGSGGTVSALGVERCLVVPETNAIRWRDEGGTPTASVGMPVAAAGVLDYDGRASAISMIAQSGTATVNVVFYGGGGVV